MLAVTDGPPACALDYRAVVLSCSHLARSWAVLECRSACLVVDMQVKVCSRETHSPRWASQIYGHNAFQITHIPLLSTVVTQLNSLWGCAVELASALTAAIILADASVTLLSPKLPKMC